MFGREPLEATTLTTARGRQAPHPLGMWRQMVQMHLRNIYFLNKYRFLFIHFLSLGFLHSIQESL